MAELLLELFSEEIPARMQARAGENLARLVAKGLGEAGLGPCALKSYATPRRLTVTGDGLAARSPDVAQERKGPRVGAPDKAIEGFLRGAGVASLDDCQTRKDKKGAYYVAIIERPGRSLTDIVAELVPEVIRAFPWPKSMRWGRGKLRWVRPLKSILCLVDGQAVGFELAGLAAGNTTEGHRFLGAGEIAVRGFADYKKKLRARKVVLDGGERARSIEKQARDCAHANGLEWVEDAPLLAETAGLVEWPNVLMGSFDETFLEVPQEVLITSMKEHQKCFSLRDPKTACLASKFLLVSNMVAKDGGTAIVAGNERVINARLSDAKFFWDNDRRTPLDEFLPRLAEVTFHEKLGTQAERAGRIEMLARELAPYVGADADAAGEAARLCKADLVSEMVYEFPELQGLMGRYYALEQGMDPAIADAIGEHYRPLGPADEVPTKPTSAAVALADKLDMLVGFWAIDETPTGSKDPYALRRAALGIIRIVLDADLRLPLFSILPPAFARVVTTMEAEIVREMLDAAQDLTQHGFSDQDITKLQDEVLVDWATMVDKLPEITPVLRGKAVDLLSFFADRLKVHLREQGARHDLIDAVYALGGQDDLLRIVKRVEALGAFLDSDDGANLLAGVKRAANILRIEEKKDKASYDGEPDPSLYDMMEEKALAEAIAEVRQSATRALAPGKEKFEAAMTAMARLRGPVDAFFDAVTVNADRPDLRANRLKLLAQIRTTTHLVADFSKIAG